MSNYSASSQKQEEDDDKLLTEYMIKYERENGGYGGSQNDESSRGLTSSLSTLSISQLAWNYSDTTATQTISESSYTTVQSQAYEQNNPTPQNSFDSSVYTQN